MNITSWGYAFNMMFLGGMSGFAVVYSVMNVKQLRRRIDKLERERSRW